MERRFHIKPDLSVAECFATTRACPYGGKENHFLTEGDAKKEADKRMRDGYLQTISSLSMPSSYLLVEGNYAEARVFASLVEEEALTQIKTLCDQPFIEGSKIRIMPDVHAGAGCVIGTTMTITDKVVPNLVGVDIGCGMETVDLHDSSIDFEHLDHIINTKIPSGFGIRPNTPHPYLSEVDLDSLRCRRGGENDELLKLERARLSLGTLGGGNHFIEVNQDEDGGLYLVIHTGSRNLGLQVANFYQKLADEKHPECPKGLAYLEGQDFEDYIHDMGIIQNFAVMNRKAIFDEIERGVRLHGNNHMTTRHNYIGLDDMILRKGAISAKEGETVLIPMNMRDGSLLCVGRGNEDWNNSGPHGAGRIMSRKKAKKELSLDEFHKTMDGIYTTSVGADTLDESPEAYKPMEHLIEQVQASVDIQKRLKPVYNFKAKG